VVKILLDPDELAGALAELFIVSKTPLEFCQNLVQNTSIGMTTIGAQLVVLNRQGDLEPLSSFGTPFLYQATPLSMWEENPVANAIRDNIEVTAKVKNPKTGQDAWVFVYPYRRPSHPVGAAIMLKEQNLSITLSSGIQKTLSLMGALWLEALGEQTTPEINQSGNPEDLTPRQIHILGMIAQGMTNRVIADDLYLSESTIKQETVKIFRCLGVATRQAAAKHAAANGVIENLASEAPRAR